MKNIIAQYAFGILLSLLVTPVILLLIFFIPFWMTETIILFTMFFFYILAARQKWGWALLNFILNIFLLYIEGTIINEVPFFRAIFAKNSSLFIVYALISFVFITNKVLIDFLFRATKRIDSRASFLDFLMKPTPIDRK